MDLPVFWYGQLVTDAQNNGSLSSMNGFVTAAQAAERNLWVDLGQPGIVSGLAVAPQSSPNMTVSVSQGVARDAGGTDSALSLAVSGKRIVVPSTQTIDLTSYVPRVAGQSLIVSIFVQFVRATSNPYVDGSGTSGFENQLESFAFVVVAGAPLDGTPTAPSLNSTMVLLADVTLTCGTTSVTNSMISTARTQYAFGITSGSPHGLAVGTAKQAIQSLLGWFNAHVGGSADQHDASAIAYAGSGAWANGIDGLPTGYVDAALNAVVSDLASLQQGTTGADRVNSGTVTCGVSGVTLALAAGTIHNQLTALTNPAYIGKAVSPAFADGSTLAASSLDTWLNGFVTKVAGLDSRYAKLAGAAFTGAVTAASFGLASPQTVTRRCMGVFYASSTDTVMGMGQGGVPAVLMPPGTNPADAVKCCYIRLNDLPDGATLNSVDVLSYGIAGGGSGAFSAPTYQIFALTRAGTTMIGTAVSNVVTDGHSAGSFVGVPYLTNVPTNTTVTVGGTTIYVLKVTHASQGSGVIGNEVDDVTVNLTTSALQP